MSDTAVRASDDDRERVAERLRSGHTEGRLDLDELQERLERTYAAKTLGELRALVSDLPRASPRRGRRRMPPLVPLVVLVLVIAAATAGHVLWLWPALGFFLLRMRAGAMHHRFR